MCFPFALYASPCDFLAISIHSYLDFPSLDNLSYTYISASAYALNWTLLWSMTIGSHRTTRCCLSLPPPSSPFRLSACSLLCPPPFLFLSISRSLNPGPTLSHTFVPSLTCYGSFSRTFALHHLDGSQLLSPPPPPSTLHILHLTNTHALTSLKHHLPSPSPPPFLLLIASIASIHLSSLSTSSHLVSALPNHTLVHI